jgi:hypothetical protein
MCDCDDTPELTTPLRWAAADAASAVERAAMLAAMDAAAPLRDALFDAEQVANEAYGRRVSAADAAYRADTSEARARLTSARDAAMDENTEALRDLKDAVARACRPTRLAYETAWLAAEAEWLAANEPDDS